MGKKKIVTPDVVEEKATDGVIFMKATRPLTEEEHEALSNKLRFEEEQTGLKMVLVPYSLEIVEGE